MSQNTQANPTALDSATLAALESVTVSGTVTANAGTGPFPVSDNGGSLTVDGTFWQATQPVSGTITETNSAAIKTAVETLDNAIAGAEMQVDIVASLPAGTNAIGKLAANAGVNIGDITIVGEIPAGTKNIGDVDVLTLPALPAGTNNIGDVDVLTLPALPAGANTIGTTLGPTLTKGTQSATGYSVQLLRDAGRNTTNFFMAAPIITTTAEVMMSLTGYKSGAAVGATATPAVVTAGKTYRITKISLTYHNVATVGSARFTLRANLSGVGVIGSPLVMSWQVGISGDGASTAGHVTSRQEVYPEGLEFAAGTGIALGMQGFGAVPTTGTIVGYGKVEIEGYEY